jgi:hypothetical protein
MARGRMGPNFDLGVVGEKKTLTLLVIEAQSVAFHYTNRNVSSIFIDMLLSSIFE